MPSVGHQWKEPTRLSISELNRKARLLEIAAHAHGPEGSANSSEGDGASLRLRAVKCAGLCTDDRRLGTVSVHVLYLAPVEGRGSLAPNPCR